MLIGVAENVEELLGQHPSLRRTLVTIPELDARAAFEEPLRDRVADARRPTGHDRAPVREIQSIHVQVPAGRPAYRLLDNVREAGGSKGFHDEARARVSAADRLVRNSYTAGEASVGSRVGATPRSGCTEVVMSVSLIVLIIVILLLIGALPSWGYSSGWGYWPSGGLGLVLLILIILMVMGRI